MKEINLLANLASPGGGEQSALKIAEILRNSGWKVNFIPWSTINGAWKDAEVEPFNFDNMAEKMKPGLPLLFYANDKVGRFVDEGEEVVKKCSDLIVGINFTVSKMPNSQWLHDSGKLRAVVFQNSEKLQDWEDKNEKGLFPDAELISLFGAIDLNNLLGVPPRIREDGEPLVVLRHSTGDSRKFVIMDNYNRGDKIHPWQRYLQKLTDVELYKHLADSLNVRFEFMVAHEEIKQAFPDDDRFVFHQWNSMPVSDFLARGHVFLYRTSDRWRDQYPRVLAEALASGMPALVEPRDGNYDRVQHGRTGFYCIDVNDYENKLRMLHDHEMMRHEMANKAKIFAKRHLDPVRWAELVEQYMSKPEEVKNACCAGKACGSRSSEQQECMEQAKQEEVKVEATEVATEDKAEAAEVRFKNLMVTNIQKHGKWSFETVKPTIYAQIENTLELGWKPEDVIIISNVDFEHMGVKSVMTDLNSNCLTGSKLYAVRWAMEHDLGDVFWAHDLDLWQNAEFLCPEFKDIGISCYSPPRPNGDYKINGGGVFWRRGSSEDILAECIKTIESGHERREEPTLNRLLKKSPLKERVTLLNTTYNVGCSGYVERFLWATKPVKGLHFKPDNAIAWETHALDRNGLERRAMSERLEAIVRRHFPHLPRELSPKGKIAHETRKKIRHERIDKVNAAPPEYGMRKKK